MSLLIKWFIFVFTVVLLNYYGQLEGLVHGCQLWAPDTVTCTIHDYKLDFRNGVGFPWEIKDVRES